MKDKYFCRQCKGVRNHKELYSKEVEGMEEEHYFMWKDKYSVIECLGCETVSFLHIYGDTSMFDTINDNIIYYTNKTIFPGFLSKSGEVIKHLLPDSIRNIYSEAVSALKTDLHILSAGGFRALIEAICNHLDIDKGNLAERIEWLSEKGYLTSKEANRLHAIRFLGNDALHEISKPQPDHLYAILEIVNHLLSNLFITDQLIKDRLPTLITTYEDFVYLILRCRNDKTLDKEISLLDLIGTKRRLINKNLFTDFSARFILEVKEDKHNGFQLSTVNPDKIIVIKPTFDF